MENWGIPIFPVSLNTMCAEETWSLGHLYIFQVFDFFNPSSSGGGDGYVQGIFAAKVRDDCHPTPISTGTGDHSQTPWLIIPASIATPWHTEYSMPSQLHPFTLSSRCKHLYFYLTKILRSFIWVLHNKQSHLNYLCNGCESIESIREHLRRRKITSSKFIHNGRHCAGCRVYNGKEDRRGQKWSLRSLSSKGTSPLKTDI